MVRRASPARTPTATLAGVVYDPMRDETCAATRDGAGDARRRAAAARRGARGSRRRSSRRASATTPPCARRRRACSRGCSRGCATCAGSARAALDLAWAACGRVDAYYERGVKHWDVAAGALICARAGLAVRELPARAAGRRGLLVAPPALADALLALVTD